jgi:hypothetical protein
MDDYFAKLFAGHMGISAVIANVLVDKGLIGADELSGRFRQAHGAASRCSSGPATAHALAEIIRYLDTQLAKSSRAPAPSRWVPRSSADARLLDAIDRRLEAFLSEQSPRTPRDMRRRPANGRAQPGRTQQRVARALPRPLNAKSGNAWQRAGRRSERLEPYDQGAMPSRNAPKRGAARRPLMPGLRVAPGQNGIWHHGVRPSPP